MDSYLKNWWLGLRFIGKLLLFLLIAGIACMPIQLFGVAVDELKKQPGGWLYTVLQITYWIILIIFLPWLYARVGKAVELLPEDKEEKPDVG